MGSVIRARQPSIMDESQEQNTYQNMQSTDEQKYMKILRDFIKKPDELTINFRVLRKFLFIEKPKLSSSIIAQSIRGDNEFKGLIEICGACEGDRNESPHLTCTSGLELLNDMMQFETNFRADLFLDIFCKTNFRKIKSLNFAAHVLTNDIKPCKVQALKLLKKYHQGNPQTDISILKFIVKEEAVFAEYNNWIGQRINYIPNNELKTGSEDDMKIYKDKRKANQSNVVGTTQFKTTTDLNFNFGEQGQDDSFISNNSLEEEQKMQHKTSPIQRKKNQLKATMCLTNNKIEITNAKEIEPLIDQKTIQWDTIFKKNGIKVKKTLMPDHLLQISITLQMPTKDAADYFLDRRDEWDNQLKDLSVLEDIDNNSKIIKESSFWQKSSKMSSIVQLNHVETNKSDQSCIYQYKQPITRPGFEIPQDEMYGKCITLIRIKEKVNKQEQQGGIHKASMHSTNSQNVADQTIDSVKSSVIGKTSCKVKIFQKAVNKDYMIYLSPLLLQESGQLLDRYSSLFQIAAKRKKTSFEETDEK